MSAEMIVAIDGPAGSGKSTLANALGQKLRLTTLDTGATYRAMAAGVLAEGIDPSDDGEVASFAELAVIDPVNGRVINGHDFSESLRSREVNQAVSLIAANRRVRALLVEWQRNWAHLHCGGIIEGRDIGTVVFPNASIKLYLTAHHVERARRRSDEGLESIQRRDHLDSSRESSPLSPADDAWVIDTTDLAVSDIVSMVVDRLSAAEPGGAT